MWSWKLSLPGLHIFQSGSPLGLPNEDERVPIADEDGDSPL